MTPQEEDMINGLIDRVQKTQLQEKDADADRLLQQGLARNSDSLYILSQTVLVQQFALDQAQLQLTDLRARIEQLQAQPHPKPATSFLGNLFGGGSNEHSLAPPPSPTQSQPPGGQYAPVPGSVPQGSYAQPGYAPASPFGGQQYVPAPQQGGFLRGAMQTAAGVAAGALAFEGVESLLHGFGNSMTGTGGGGGRPEEIVNNYYGEDAGERSERGSNFADKDRSQDNNDPGSTIFTDSGDRDNFSGTDDDGDESSFSDTGDVDDSGFDDGDDSLTDDSSGDNSF